MFSSNIKFQTFFSFGESDKMKTESSNREEEITLKQARLSMLLMASEELVDRNYSQSREYLLIFVDTVS